MLIKLLVCHCQISDLPNVNEKSEISNTTHKMMTTTTTTTSPVLWPYVRDHPGEPIPERWTIRDSTEAETMGWQWHQLDHM